MSYEGFSSPFEMDEETFEMSSGRRQRHNPEQILKKLRDAEAMLNSGKELSVVLQALEISQSSYDRWRNQYGGMKSEEVVRLKKLEDENKRLKQIVADQALDIQMLKHIAEGNW
jgi:phage anti-repressor protein